MDFHAHVLHSAVKVGSGMPPSGRDPLIYLSGHSSFMVSNLEYQNIIHMFNNNFNSIIIIMVIWSYIITNDQIKLFLLSFFLIKIILNCLDDG